MQNSMESRLTELKRSFQTGLSIIALLFSACDRASTLGFEDGELPEATRSIAGLKSLCDGERLTIADQTIIRGTVTGNNRYGEFGRTLVIQDASGGIAIAADYPAAGNPYPLGTEAIVYCNGLTLYDYGGKIRLGKIAGGDLCIPHEELNRHIRISGRSPQRIAALPMRIDELTPAHADTYVRIDNVRFVETGAWCDRDPQTGRYTTTERTLEDPAGHRLNVRTSGGCTYAGEPLPEGSGSLCGIVDRFGGSYSLRITGFETAFVTPPATPAKAYP